jgi:hypothetical protein
MGRARKHEGLTRGSRAWPYVEYSCGRGRPKFVVQRGVGPAWHLFEVHPGKDGAVKTLDTGSKPRLVAEARKLAQKCGENR